MGAPGTTTEHQLRRRLARGLRLAAAGVAVACDGRPAVPGAPRLVRSEVLAETALLCRVAGRLLADDPQLTAHHGLGAAQARLFDALTRTLDPHRAAHEVAADPRTLVREVSPFALLGDLDTDHRAVARRLLDLVPAEDELGDEPGAPERLEVAWLRGLTEGCASPDVPSGSVLQRGADLLHGERTAARALARAVLQATDCGLLTPRVDRPATSVADDAEALLGAALAADDLDLAAELLATWPMLGLPLSHGARYALAELDRTEAVHGFLPGPEHDAAVAAQLAPTDRSAYVIRTSHHAGVAGALLAAALLRAGTGAPAGVRTASGRMPSPTADADPLPLVRLADGPWADALREAPLEERIACTELVLGAQLRTAAARRDPARVHQVVTWASDRGWGHLPSVRQGAALLDRVARVAAPPVSVAS